MITIQPGALIGAYMHLLVEVAVGDRPQTQDPARVHLPPLAFTFGERSAEVSCWAAPCTSSLRWRRPSGFRQHGELGVGVVPTPTAGAAAAPPWQTAHSPFPWCFEQTTGAIQHLAAQRAELGEQSCGLLEELGLAFPRSFSTTSAIAA